MITIEWWWIVLAAFIGVCVLVWEKGWLGTATETRIKNIRDELLDKVQEWDQRLENKVAKRLEKQKAEPAETVHVSLIKDKGTRIAENKELLDKGLITQAEFDAAKQAILTE